MIHEVVFLFFEDNQEVGRVPRRVSIEPWDDHYVLWNNRTWQVNSINWDLNYSEEVLRPELKCVPYIPEPPNPPPAETWNDFIYRQQGRQQ
jgi:hypothetical protein